MHKDQLLWMQGSWVARLALLGLLLCPAAIAATEGVQAKDVQAKGVQADRMIRTKPNIVVLFADDLGWGDLGSYGHPNIATPHLDKLANEGQRWTSFYAPASVCSPSRAALLTGRLPNRTGMFGRQIAVLFPNDTAGMPSAELTLAEGLKGAGYATGIVGKWHLGDAPDTWPTRHGFDYWYGVPYSNDMDWVDEPTFDEVLMLRAQGKQEELAESAARRFKKWLHPKNEYWNVPLLLSRKQASKFQDEVVERPAVQKNLTQNYTAAALAFIERNRTRPFFLYLPYSMPHTPIFRSDAFVDKSLGGRYGDVIEELDGSVGAIVSKLRELKLEENTLVVFTSDNGPWLWMQTHGGSAGPFNNGKGTTFEGGMRVPGIFWWPGSVDPGEVHGIGSAMDLFATSLALAGVDATSGTDAFDLSAVLLKAAPSPRTELAYYRSGELRAYRYGQFKLSFVSQGAYGMPPERIEHANPLLYDLAADPAERFDVADKYPTMVAKILSAVAKHQRGINSREPIFDRRLADLVPPG